MTAKQLLDAIGQLDERYIEEAEAEIHGRNRRLVVRWAATAAAILLVFISVLGTVMAVNAGFRQMVFSFFHIGQVESVPDHNDRGFHVSKSDIGGRIQAEYIQLGDSYYESGDGVLYHVDYGENDTVRSVRFWNVQDGTAVEIDTQKKSFSTAWQGETYQGEIYWCIHDGGVSVYGEGTYTDGSPETGWLTNSVSGRSDAVLLYLSQGRQQDYRQYPMLYHLDTEKTEDFLQGTGAEDLSNTWDYQWSGGLDRVIITCLETGDEKTYYFCDVTKKSLTNLSTLTDQKIDGAFFADHDTLLLVQVSEDQKSCSVFTYDVATGRLVQALRRENYFLQDYGTYSIVNYGMMFFGGRYGLYVDPKKTLSVVDLKTGSKTPVNNFVFQNNGSFLSNPSKTKLLYSVTEEITDESMGFSQLGVLDLEGGTFTAFDREGYAGLKEWCIGWFDDNRVEISSSQSGTNALYLYTF